MVSTAARWTLNALSGGYCREVTKHGQLTDQAIEGPYRTLMEGIETFAALGAKTEGREDEDQQPIAYDRRGVAYRSAMPAPRERR